MTSAIVVATTVATPTAATAIVSIARSASRRCSGWRTTQHTTMIQIVGLKKNERSALLAGWKRALPSWMNFPYGSMILTKSAFQFPHSSPSISSAVVTHLFFSVANTTHLWNNISLAFFLTPTLWLPTYSVWSFPLTVFISEPIQKNLQNSCSFANFLSYQRHLLCFLLLMSLWLPKAVGQCR